MDLLPPPQEPRRNSKGVIIALTISTLILSIVAVFSAIKLYQLRQEPVAPTAPEKTPAQEVTPTPGCFLSFTVPTPTPTNTPTPTPTNTPTPTPTPTPIPECWSICEDDSQCPSELSCLNGHCANPECPDEEDCTCPVPTPTPTNTPTPTPTNTPTPTQALITQEQPTPTPTRIELPEAGIVFPSQLLIIVGSIVSLGGLLLLL